MAKLASAPDISEIIDAVRADVAAGESVIERAREDHGIGFDGDDDGPLTQAWKRRDQSVKATPSMISEMLASLIGYIVEAERRGRPLTVGVGLTRLREHYDGYNPRDLPADEQTWQAFALKHVPLPAARVVELIGKVRLRGGMLRCTKCGTRSKAECGCGAPYVGEHRWAMRMADVPEPAVAETALDRAMAAIAASPEKSNRAIAAEIGVSAQTVKRAREQMEQAVGDVAPDVAPDRRTGRDGRSYPVARKDVPLVELDYDLTQEMHPDAITPEQRWQWSAAALFGDLIAARAYWKREFGDWQTFRPPVELLALMDQASSVMQSLTSDLGKGGKHGEAAHS